MKEKVRIKINGEEIVGTMFLPDKKKKHKTVVFLNGKGGTKERFYLLAKDYLEKDYVSFCFDFRGRGESLTKTVPPLGSQLKDAKVVLDYLATLPFVDKRNIILVGTSMGGYVALSIPNYKPGIKKLIILEPAYFLPDMENKPYLDITDRDVEEAIEGGMGKARSMKEIGKFAGELYLVIHEKSGHFELMEKVIDIYYNSAVNAKIRKKMEIKGAPHAIFRTPGNQNRARKFIKKLL